MLLSIKNLGLTSVNSDLTPCDLPPEVFTNATNYVLRNNKIASFNLSKTLFTPASNFYAGLILPVLVTSGSFYLLMGRTAAYVFNGTAWSVVTSVAGYAGLNPGDELLWNGCLLGNIPIVNNINAHPEYWSPQSTGQVLQPLNFDASHTWAAKGYQAKVIRSHRNFLFALGLYEGGVDLPTSYRWSHPADINGLPYTWDETDLASIASKESIAGDGGSIVDGLSLRDAFCIYSQKEINILDYVGGSYVFNRRILTSDHGLLAKNCVVEALGVHYFLTSGDIMLNDGNSVQSILHKKMRDALTANIDSSHYATSFAHHNPITKELWFCVPKTGSPLPNWAIIYNYIDGTLSQRNLPGIHTGLCFGPILSTPIVWSNVTDTWDSDANPWSYDPTSPFSNSILATDNTVSAITALEIDDSSTTQDTLLERESVPLVDHVTVVTTQNIYPHIECAGPVQLQFGSQQAVGYPVLWKPVVQFNPNTQRKVDYRVTGPLVSWRISSIGTLPFSISGMDIEYTTNGVR